MLSAFLLIGSFLGLFLTPFLLIVKSTEKKLTLCLILMVLTYVSYFINLLLSTTNTIISSPIPMTIIGCLGATTLFYLFIFFRPMVSNHLPSVDSDNKLEAPIPAKQKYQKSHLQAEQKTKLVEQLIAKMEEEQVYCEAALTLSKLAKQLNTSTHAISQVVNEKIGCSFLAFINRYRVQAAKEKLQNPQYEHYTILSIGYEVGFNSKTAFYTAFRKQLQTTPGNFRKSYTQRALAMR